MPILQGSLESPGDQQDNQDNEQDSADAKTRPSIGPIIEEVSSESKE